MSQDDKGVVASAQGESRPVVLGMVCVGGLGKVGDVMDWNTELCIFVRRDTAGCDGEGSGGCKVGLGYCDWQGMAVA